MNTNDIEPNKSGETPSFLDQVSREGPFEAPDRYFGSFMSVLADKIEDEDVLENAPNLRAAGKENIFLQPSHYAASFPNKVMETIQASQPSATRTLRQLWQHPQQLVYAMSVAAAVVLLVMGMWVIGDQTHTQDTAIDYWSIIEQTDVDAFDIAEVFDLSAISFEGEEFSEEEVSDLLDLLDQSTFDLEETLIEGI